MASKPMPKHLRPQGKFPPCLTFHEAPFRWIIRWYIGWMWRKDRRCPNCAKRGYWFAYGGQWQDIPKRRWLCKWCGYMDSINGQEWCGISHRIACWVGAALEEVCYTPESVLAEAMERMAEPESTDPEPDKKSETQGDPS